MNKQLPILLLLTITNKKIKHYEEVHLHSL